MNPNSNLIILRSVYKITEMIVEPARNPKTGRYPECVRPLDSNGNMVLSDQDRKKSIDLLIPENKAIKIFDGKTFDLDDPYEQAEWEAIKFSRRIAKARDEKDEFGNLVIDGGQQRYGTAEFYVEIPGLEARELSKKKRLVHESEQYVYDDTYEGLITKARVLGLMVKGLSHSEVEQMLIKRAQVRPKDIKDLYESKEIYYRILFIDSVDAGVFRKRDGLFYYGDVLLGSNEESVVAYMKKPESQTILKTIKEEVYGAEFVGEVKTAKPAKK